MIHTVRDWMTSPVLVVDPDSSVFYAATLMRRRNVRSLVVDLTAEKGGYGIVTSTDVSNKVLLAEHNPSEMTVRDIMTAPVVTGKPEWSLKEASALMQQHKFHHLPIVDDHSMLVGIISDTDIFMAVEEIGWKK
jgi:CBS domain-containing protein